MCFTIFHDFPRFQLSAKSRKSRKKLDFSCENTGVLDPWLQNTCVFTAKPWFFPTFLTFSKKLKPWKIMKKHKTPVFSQLNVDFFRFFRLFRLFGKRFACLGEASQPARQATSQLASQPTSRPVSSPPASRHSSESQLFLKKSEKYEKTWF